MFDWFRKKAPAAGAGSDFSGITSQAMAEELHGRGELHKLYLMPLDFGGDDNKLNVVYVPAFAVETKNRIDSNIVKPLVAQGKISQYSASPVYQGASFIPSAIHIKASDPGDFSAVVRIWGDALKEGAP